MWLLKVQNPWLATIGKPLFRVTILSHNLSLNNTGWPNPFSFFQNSHSTAREYRGSKFLSSPPPIPSWEWTAPLGASLGRGFLWDHSPSLTS